MTDHVLFIGDSVTDCGRRDDPDGLGDGYVRLVRRLAAEHGAVLVPASGHLTAMAGANATGRAGEVVVPGAAALAADGVHPTAAGHRALADLWWASVG